METAPLLHVWLREESGYYLHGVREPQMNLGSVGNQNLD